MPPTPRSPTGRSTISAVPRCWNTFLRKCSRTPGRDLAAVQARRSVLARHAEPDRFQGSSRYGVAVHPLAAAVDQGAAGPGNGPCRTHPGARLRRARSPFALLHGLFRPEKRFFGRLGRHEILSRYRGYTDFDHYCAAPEAGPCQRLAVGLKAALLRTSMYVWNWNWFSGIRLAVRKLPG